MALWPVEPDVQSVAVPVGLYGFGQLRHRCRSPFGQPPGEFRPGLQRRIRQGLGDHPTERGSVAINAAQHVITHRGRLRPRPAPVGELVQGLLDGVHGDHPAVISGTFGQRERRGIGRGVDPDADSGGQFQDGHEYLFISSCLYSLPVSVRGRSTSNEMVRGHL